MMLHVLEAMFELSNSGGEVVPWGGRVSWCVRKRRGKRCGTVTYS